LRKYEKVCLNLRKCVKSSKSAPKSEKVGESVQNLRKCAKSWESVLKVEKVCQNLRKLEKVWECVVNANGNANCYLFAVQMLIFFTRSTKLDVDLYKWCYVWLK